MQEKPKLFIVLVGLFIYLLSIPTSARTFMTAEVNQRELTLQEELVLKIVVIQESTNQSMPTPKGSFVLPEIEGFAVFSQSSTQNATMSNGTIRVVLQYDFYLKPLKSGQFTIPSLQFPYLEDGKQLSTHTEPIAVQVKEEALLGYGVNALILVGLSFLVLGILLTVFWKATRPKQPIKIDVFSEEKPDFSLASQPITIMGSLHGLLQEDMSPGEVINQAQEILKTYLQSHYQLDCFGKTTTEIAEQLEGIPMAVEQKAQIISCLKQCDELKFQPITHSTQHLRRLVEQIEKILADPSHSVNH